MMGRQSVGAGGDASVHARDALDSTSIAGMARSHRAPEDQGNPRSCR
jgi:hypothetical protein